MQQACQGRETQIKIKGFLASMAYLMTHGAKPPVILIDGKVACQGRIPTRQELHAWGCKDV